MVMILKNGYTNFWDTTERPSNNFLYTRCWKHLMLFNGSFQNEDPYFKNWLGQASTQLSSVPLPDPPGSSTLILFQHVFNLYNPSQVLIQDQWINQFPIKLTCGQSHHLVLEDDNTDGKMSWRIQRSSWLGHGHVSKLLKVMLLWTTICQGQGVCWLDKSWNIAMKHLTGYWRPNGRVSTRLATPMIPAGGGTMQYMVIVGKMPSGPIFWLFTLHQKQFRLRS